MTLQIIHDSKGNSTGVFIPMDEWMIIKSSYPNIEDIAINESGQMELAAKALLLHYQNDKDLTAFTNLDFEDFYETR